MKRPVVCGLGALMVWAFHASTALGCAVCYGDPQAPMTNGMNMAILSLLGITGGVLSVFVAFFVFLRKRARAMLNGPLTIEDVLTGRKD